jgi:hypothetical protein
MMGVHRSLSLLPTKHQLRTCVQRFASSRPASRQIVRDPRIKAKEKEASSERQQLAVVAPDNVAKTYDDPLRNQISPKNEQSQQSFGSSLGTYVVLGAGVSLGFALVRLVLGG